MAREMAAVQMLTAQAFGLCAAAPDCRKQLRPGELEAAENSALDSIGRFQALADKDHESLSLQDDIAWGREVQASLKRARGERDQAITLIDRSIALRRPLIIDPRDVEHKLGIATLIRSKAEVLEDAGRREEAVNLLDESLAAVRQLPPGGLPAYQLNTDLLYKADLLTKLGRKDEAAQARTEGEEVLKKAGDPATARTTRASSLRLEALTAHVAALKTTAAGPAADYDVIVKKYEESLAANPLSGDAWDDLESACSSAAEHLPEAEGPAASVRKQQKEAALRCALESAWMAWVLSDAGPATGSGSGSKQLMKLYEARRELAKFLRNDTNGLREALALAEQGVREAETRAQAQKPTAESLSLIADAYFGLAMMREENRTDGWEEAFHAAIRYREQSMGLEPGRVEDRIWLSQVHNELAKRLESAKRDGSAAERESARRDCREAVRLARTPEDRKTAQSCGDNVKQ
jgi:tetratricopeptide (TPR) repeat protein